MGRHANLVGGASTLPYPSIPYITIKGLSLNVGPVYFRVRLGNGTAPISMPMLGINLKLHSSTKETPQKPITFSKEKHST